MNDEQQEMPEIDPAELEAEVKAYNASSEECLAKVDEAVTQLLAFHDGRVVLGSLLGMAAKLSRGLIAGDISSTVSIVQSFGYATVAAITVDPTAPKPRVIRTHGTTARPKQ